MSGFHMDHYHQHTYVPGQEIAKPNTRWIWKVFFIMLLVTIVEVGFAFANDAGMGQTRFISFTVQKWIFIALTLVKAYYIIFSFMHLGHERFNFKLTISLTTVFLVYFIVLMMMEGYALRDVKLKEPDFFNRTYKDHHAAPAAGHGDEAHGEAHSDSHAH